MATTTSERQSLEHTREPTSEVHGETVDNEKGEKYDNVTEATPEGSIFTQEELPHGVRLAEAMTASWTKKELYVVYGFILLVFFINSLGSQICNNLSAYAVSSFSSAPLLSTIYIPANIVSGLFRLPTAKIIDIWGRAEGYAFMTFLFTLALVMMAACNNVETYAAAYIFYWVGYDGIMYVLQVVIADTSSLKNRALWFAFTTSPYIVTTWCGSPAAQSLVGSSADTSNWRWGYGAFAIVTPVVAAPLFFILWRAQQRAKKTLPGVSIKLERSFFQKVIFYAIEFDVIGMILICAAWTLFLLPFSLESYQAKGWKSGLVISMWVIGLLCFPAFAAWEKWGAPKQFIPYRLLTDRTVLTACLLAMVLWISFYCWDSYFTYFLQVVYGLSVTDAGYVLNIYSIGSCFWGIVVGLIIRRINHFRILAWVAAPVMLLFSGLMIHFRQPDQDIGYTIMCQIFISFAGGTLVICEEMAVMAAAPHVNVAAILALLAMFTSPGASIGEAIAGAIYTQVMPRELTKRLTAIGQADLEPTIYASLYTQLDYPQGSEVREAINGAYGVMQKDVCIAATAVVVLAPILVLFWRNYNVAELRQVKGRVA